MKGTKVSTKVYEGNEQGTEKIDKSEKNLKNNDNIKTDNSIGNIGTDDNIIDLGMSFESDGLLDSLSSDSMQQANDSIDKDLKNADEFIQKKQETTRSKIGTIFVRGFFLFMFLGFIGVIVYNVFIYAMTGTADLFMDSATIIPLIGSIIGTPLGFVMGYYFKR